MALAVLVAAEVHFCERPVIGPAARWVENRNLGLLPALRLPPLLEKLLGVVLLDYSLYWWHVLLHKVPMLWRFHAVHHSDRALDTTTAARFHALEFAASVPWRLAQVVLLGVKPSTLALWQSLTTAEVLFHHSNLKLPIAWERVARAFVVTPRMHGIHHSVVPEETHSNFSSGLTLWDRLHKTFRTNPAQHKLTIGVAEQPERLNLLELLIWPFRKNR